MEVTKTLGKMSSGGLIPPRKGKAITAEQHAKGKIWHCRDEIIPIYRWNKKKGLREKTQKHSRAFICHCCD